MDEFAGDADLAPMSALQHWLYCPRQFALIHLEQCWAENQATIAGRLGHSRVNRQASEVRHGVLTVTAMPLRSLRLRVSGVADVVELRRDGQRWMPLPVEHKHGRPKAHRADEVQLCAQAIALEEMFDTRIAEGHLFYGATRRRIVVPLDLELRKLTEQTAADVHACLASGTTPGSTYVPDRCDPCSMMEICRPKCLGRTEPVRTWLERLIED